MLLKYWFPVGLPTTRLFPVFADDLKGVWIECSAEFVSLVLLDKDFITQFDAGGTGTAVYVFISFTLSFLFSIAIMCFMVISMVVA